MKFEEFIKKYSVRAPAKRKKSAKEQFVRPDIFIAPPGQSPKEATQSVANGSFFNYNMLGDTKDSEKDWYNRPYAARRQYLRLLSLQPELDDILDTMTNEAVVTDTSVPISITCGDNKMSDEDAEALSIAIKTSCDLLGGVNNITTLFKRFLVDGILSYFIVRGEDGLPQRLDEVDPQYLRRVRVPKTGEEYFEYNTNGPRGKVKLLAKDVLYITFADDIIEHNISYLDRLVRPFNIYRIIEQSQIIWNVVNAGSKMSFTIPVDGMSQQRAVQTLSSAMNRYHEDIRFDHITGELSVNGKPNLAFNKEYWMASSDAGTPEINAIDAGGPDLQDESYIKFFRSLLYKYSKIPLSRFDTDAGATWVGTDASSYEREEIMFARYVAKLRHMFEPLILTTFYELAKARVKDFDETKCELAWKTYNQFEEMMNLELMAKRVEHIQSMQDSLKLVSPDGEETPYFSCEFLIKKYLKFTPEEIKDNAKMRKAEQEEAAKNATEFNNGME